MEDLAINGGPKSIAENLKPERPGLNWVDDEERKAIVAALDGHAWSGTLEDDLRNFYQCAWAASTNSGTGALYSAASALGLHPGMEVLVPGFCWIPTFACVLSVGAIPVPVEVGEDLGIDVADAERKINQRTRAILPVHMCGAAADMDRVMELARKHDLLVIEDCAQDGAGKFRGKYVGLFGDIGCFSLQANKHFTCFTGGYMLSRHKHLQAIAAQARDCGLPRVMNVVSHEIDEHVTWGQGRNLNPLAQAMAKVQLRKAPRIIASMQASHRRIRDGIGNIAGLRFRPLPDPESDCGSFLVTYWPTAEKARRAAEALKAEGAPQWLFHLADYGTHMYYHMLNLVKKAGWSYGSQWPWNAAENTNSCYSYSKGSLPKSDEIFSRGVVMAVPSKISGDECDRIAYAYRKAAAHIL